MIISKIALSKIAAALGLPQILFHAKVLEKVYLNLDPLKDLVANCYSPIGRPAQKQPELFRALVVMTHYSNDGITRFVERYIITFWHCHGFDWSIPVKVLSMIFHRFGNDYLKLGLIKRKNQTA